MGCSFVVSELENRDCGLTLSDSFILEFVHHPAFFSCEDISEFVLNEENLDARIMKYRNT